MTGTKWGVRQRPLDNDTADWMTNTEAAVAAYSGHLGQARTLSRRAVGLARQAHRQDRAGSFEAAAAVREAFFGNLREARESARYLKEPRR